MEMFTLKGKLPLKRLSAGVHNEVWALDTTLVAKLFILGDPQARRELTLLQQATDLLPKVSELTPSDGYEHELLVMERLELFEKRNFDHEVRAQMLDRFSQELEQLHQAGWAHGDIRRTTDQGGPWDNVVWTRERIRLIDAGNAVLQDEATFEATRQQDMQDLQALRVWAMKD
jgi:tRNA A-37 threonylcarbamoyl transferase component Bud32